MLDRIGQERVNVQSELEVGKKQRLRIELGSGIKVIT